MVPTFYIGKNWLPFKVEWEPRGVVVRNFGLVTRADGDFTSEALSSDPRLTSIDYVIVDFRDASEFRFAGPAETEYSSAVTIGAAQSIPDLVAAFIHPDSDVRLQMEPVLSRFPFPTSWFDTEDAAREWIMQVRRGKRESK
jgi:hypothetical protein